MEMFQHFRTQTASKILTHLRERPLNDLTRPKEYLHGTTESHWADQIY